MLQQIRANVHETKGERNKDNFGKDLGDIKKNEKC